MSRAVRLGFVPLLDAAPLIVAQTQGFFAREGLDVELSRELSWATVRDKVAVGALDGAHMLAPMALAASLGAEGAATPMVAPFVLNRGGAAVILSSRIRGDQPASALRRLVAMRREQGATPLTFAVVFPHSILNFLLRRWLADAGLDPDEDVRITVAPPPRMPELLADGVIEGFCAGQPWSEAARASGAGEVAARADAFWPGAPDKVLALRADWAGAHASRTDGLLRALRDAVLWMAKPSHFSTLVGLLACDSHVGVDESLVRAALECGVWADPAGCAPTEGDAGWLVQQMNQTGQLKPLEADGAAQQTFRRDLYERATSP